MTIHSGVVLLAYLSIRAAWRSAYRRRAGLALTFLALAGLLSLLDLGIWEVTVRVVYYTGK